mgnify:FL=1
MVDRERAPTKWITCRNDGMKRNKVKGQGYGENIQYTYQGNKLIEGVSSGGNHDTQHSQHLQWFIVFQREIRAHTGGKTSCFSSWFCITNKNMITPLTREESQWDKTSDYIWKFCLTLEKKKPK